ncbi:MAG: glycosyltransferase family 39 protein [Chloroflexia bacterium]
MQQPQTATLSPAPTAGSVARVRASLRAVPTWGWVAGLTVAAGLLRLYHLGAESFWFDEADIVRQAQQPLAGLLTLFTHAGENGPLYTLLLHFWLKAAGTSEAAVRLLPAAFGAATVPVIYYTGKRILSRELGLLAAGLLAVSPFHIWHSQDAKMYTLVVLVTLGSTAIYLRALERGEARWWAAYVLATWVALFAHSMAILILLAQVAATPLLWPHARKEVGTAARQAAGQRRRRWAIAMLVLVIPFLPTAWERLYAAIVGNITGGWHPSLSLWDMLGVLFVKFALNRADQPWEAAGALLAGSLFAVGLMPWARPHRRTWAFLALMWLLPIAIFYVITLKVPLFEPRYLILVLPYYLLFVAMGILRVARASAPLAWAAVLALLALQGVALTQVNYSPQPQKEEWRQAMDYVRQHVRLRDVIIVDPGYLATAVDLYYAPSGDVPRVPVKAVPNLQTTNFGTRELSAWLDGAITDHERAWIITSPERTSKDDPNNAVAQFFEGKIWPNQRYYQFDTQEFVGVNVVGYAFNGQPHSWFPHPVYPQPVSYEGRLNFLGVIYEMRNGSDDKVNVATWLPVTLYWHFDAQPQPDQDYIISLRLLDARGKEWAAYDQAPLNGLRPMTTFPANETVIDYADLFIPGNAPPGQYHMTMTLWPRCTGGVCWNAASPREHAGGPLQIFAGQSVTSGSGTLTFEHPITVLPLRP